MHALPFLRASLLLALLIIHCVALIQPGLSQDSLLPVEVATIVEEEVNSSYRVVGTVIPLRTSTIGSAVAGRVKEFVFDQGQPVAAGQTLARLRTETLELERQAAKYELVLYEQQLAELVNGSRAEEIAEAQANASGAKAAMDNAASQLKRIQTLAGTRAATDADLEDARERARFTQFAFAAAEAMSQRITAGPRKEQIAQAQARVDLQKQNIAIIEDRIEKHTIVAPFDGFVSEEYTEVGAWIGSGDPVVQIIQLNEVEIQAQVTADYATKLRLGDTIRVEFPELPDELLTGRVDRIVPVAESRARTFPVLIRMQNRIQDASPMLMAGMLARVELPAGRRTKMPLVPKDALVLNENERAIFIFEPDANGLSGTVRKVSVELGVAVGGKIQVMGALRSGQQVVVNGNERLSPNAKVSIAKKSEADRPAG